MMASSMPDYSNPQASLTRFPKLSYRTKSCDTESLSSASTGVTRFTASTTATSPLHSSFCPSPRSPPSEMSFPPSPRRSTFAPSSKTPTLPKKRSNFFSSIFSVKEPSAQALQDYQRQLMKQGGGRVTAVGMPGVSSAKLPPTVPKVNSKWDGVPHALKEREKQNDAARQSMSGLSRQLGTSKSEGSDHRATSTADSSKKRLSRGTLGGESMQSSSSNYLAELYGWETTSSYSRSSVTNFSVEHRPTTSQSAPPLRQNSSFFPHDPSPPPAVPFPPTELSPPSPIGSPNPPSLSYSPMLTPYDLSPATPDAPPFLSLTSPKSEASHQENTKTTLLEVSASAEEVVVKSTGVNILGPPAAAKRKPKPTPLQSSNQRPNTSGGDFQSNSTVCKTTPVSKNTPSPCPPLASYFPNTMTAPSPAKSPARRNSTRERLRLGMSLKNQNAAPWQSLEQATDINAERERTITPTPEGGKSFRRKSRMTLFKK